MENKKQLRLVWEKAKSLQNYDSIVFVKINVGHGLIVINMETELVNMVGK